jgi:ribonuclease D
MTTLCDTGALAELCARLARAGFVAVDTEFMRDRTYWPRLCLVQIAGPGDGDVAAIDALAPGLDLAPLYELLNRAPVVKVFHAMRQDIEIFYQRTGEIPAPVFDTQVAAMVCGFGDSVAYDRLAAQIAGARIDKASRFTDWSRRPLSDQQLRYALSDVIHLRPIYQELERRLADAGRESWVAEEMAVLCDPETYQQDPRKAWLRFKTRNPKPKFLAILREVAAWREEEAQRRDLPRGRILKDETVLEIAATAPHSREQLQSLRGVGRDLVEGARGNGILHAVETALALPRSEWPQPAARRELPSGLGPLIDLLKVLLKARCEMHDVAPKLVASAPDLEEIAAADDADVPAMHGWRRTLFGDMALALKHGEIALSADHDRIAIVPLEADRVRRRA